MKAPKDAINSHHLKIEDWAEAQRHQPQEASSAPSVSRRAFIVGIGANSLLLSGCGGGQDGGAESATASGGGTSSVDAPPADGASTKKSVATAWTTGVTSFVHPGIGFNASDLAQFKAYVQAGKEPWSGAYKSLAKDGHSSLNYAMKGPFAEVSRNPDVNLNEYKSDMQAAYNLAMMWYMTDTADYATKSIGIMMAWAKTNVSFVGAESGLAIGDYVARIIAGADLLRGLYKGWTLENTLALQKYFKVVYWPSLVVGAGSRATDNAGIGSVLKAANQGALALKASTAIAVFMDDPVLFDGAINAFLTDPEGLDGSYANGEVGDTGRDQGHATGQVLHYTYVAELAWKQGIDLYSARNNRLLAMGEYLANYNLGNSYSYIPISSGYGFYPVISNDDKNAVKTVPTLALDVFELLCTAYMRLGAPTPRLTQYRDADLAAGGGSYMSIMYRRDSDSSRAAVLKTLPWSPPTTAKVSTLTSADLGAALAAGANSVYDTGNDTWKLTGAGKGSDQGFHFAYQALTGDATIFVGKIDPTTLAAGTNAGIQIRNSLDPKAKGSSYVHLYVTRIEATETTAQTWATHYFSRGYTNPFFGGARTFTTGALPMALKLVRRGNFIYAYISVNAGVDWSPMGNFIFASLPETIYAGLSVSSGDPAVLATASFSNVQIGSQPNSLPAVPKGLIATVGSKGIELSWAVSERTRGYDVLRATSSGGTYTTLAYAVDAIRYTDATAVSGTSYYYVIKASGYSGLSGASNEVSAVAA